MIRPLLVAFVASWTLAACAPHATGFPPYAASLLPDERATLDELSRVRALPVEAPVPIERVDDATFLRVFHDANHSASRQGARATVFWSAFTMTSATNVGAMGQDLLDENLAGFYDQRTKRLYLRAVAKPDKLTLAHEEEHALQDRYFGVPDLDTIHDADQALSLRAIFEGDATLASLVLDGVRSGETSAEKIAEIARLAENDDALIMAASGMKAPKDAPPLLRAEVLWPYMRGTAFVAQLAASGGWALVDAALRNPPKTTEQVLHVEKYIAGEGAIEVRAPVAPDGYALVERGRMGELRTRFFLAQCMRDVPAGAAARGWGGDAYAIVTSGPARALLWSTAWDDEPSAARFAAALEARRDCKRTGAKPVFSVRVEGTRVAFVQGLDDDAHRSEEASTLLALVGKPPPPVPPLGEVQLRARPPIARDFAHGDVVEDGRFVDRPLGLESDLVDLKRTNSSALELVASGEFVNVDVGFAWAPPSRALSDTMMNAFVEVLRRDHPKEEVFDAGTRRVQLSWTTADARMVRVGSRLDMRFVLAPTCGGRMTFFLVSAWKIGTFGEGTANAWLKSVRASDSSPACDALKTQLDPVAGAK